MICPSCGSEIPEGTIYCEHCGQEIQVVPDYNLLEDDVLPQILEDKPEDTGSAAGEKKSAEVAASSSEAGRKVKSDSDATRHVKRSDDASLSNIALWIVGVCVMVTIALVVYSLVDRHMHSYGYILEQADSADSEGRYEAAIDYYDELLTLNDDDAELLFKKGRDSYRLGDYETATELLTEVIGQQPDNAEAYEILLIIYDESRDYEAMELLTAATDDEEILAMIDEYLILPPVVSIHGGDYDDDIELTLVSTEGYEIRYTLDGEDPETGEVYEEPIELTDGTTLLRAVCIDDGGKAGFELSETYRITYTMPGYPRVSPESGTYTEPVAIVIESDSEDAAIYYAWDDDNPTVYSNRYYGPIEMPVGNHILSVIVINTHGLSSDVIKYNYDYEPAVAPDEGEG